MSALQTYGSRMRGRTLGALAGCALAAGTVAAFLPADSRATGDDQPVAGQGAGDGTDPAAQTGGPASRGPRVREFTMTPRALRLPGDGREPVARFRFTVSEDANVTLRFKRLAPGRRLDKRCVPVSRRSAGGRACKRYAKAGALRFDVERGAHTRGFDGRVGGKLLGPGSYVVVAGAEDAAGKGSPLVPVRFEVVAR